MSRNYYRAFLPIKQERSDYSLSGREAVGKAIIDARGGAGKIWVTMQGVKKKSQLDVYMIANISNEYIGVYVGKLMIDENGRGDCRHEFDADSVMKSDIAIEAFTIVALIVPKEVELIVPFVGYKNELVAWKVNFKCFKEAEKSEISVTQVEAFSEHEEISKIEPVIAANEVLSGTIAEDIAEKEPEEEQEKDETEINPHDKFREIARKFSEKFEELKKVETQENKQPIHEEIEKLFETNTIMYPFKQKKSDVIWVRISPKNLAKLPEEFSCHANCPIVLNGFRSFKHLVFGKYCQDGFVKFLLGVPDIYYEQKKQSAEEYGFLKFECCDGEELFNGAYGYWIMVI